MTDSIIRERRELKESLAASALRRAGGPPGLEAKEIVFENSGSNEASSEQSNPSKLINKQLRIKKKKNKSKRMIALREAVVNADEIKEEARPHSALHSQPAAGASADNAAVPRSALYPRPTARTSAEVATCEKSKEDDEEFIIPLVKL